MMKSGLSSKNNVEEYFIKNNSVQKDFHKSTVWQEDANKFEAQNRTNHISGRSKNYPFVQKIDFCVNMCKKKTISLNSSNPQKSKKSIHMKSTTGINTKEITFKYPLVDQTSEKIINMTARIPLVEERLIKAGKDLEQKRQKNIKQREYEINSQSTPKIIPSICRNRSESSQNGDIVTRLLRYKEIYATKKANLEDKYYENKSFTFEPKICHSISSQFLLTSQMQRKISQHHQNSSSQNECTFHPKLGQKTMRIVLKLPSFSVRNLESKCYVEQLPDFVHKPTINSRSQELASHLTSKRDSKNLFEKLYLDSQELKNKLELISKQNQAHESNGLPDCTFQPSINRSYSLNQFTEPLFVRTIKWKENKEKKMESEKTKMDRIRIAECTFRPSAKRLDIKDNGKYKSLKEVKDADKYVQRLTSLKKLKEQQMNSINQLPGSGRTWKKHLTRPSEFVFSTSERKAKRDKKND